MGWCLVCLCVVTVKGASGVFVIQGGRTMSSYCHHAQGALPTKIQNSLQYHVTFMLRRGGRGKGGSHSFLCPSVHCEAIGGWPGHLLFCSLSLSSPANLHCHHCHLIFQGSQSSVITTFLHAASPMAEFWTLRPALTTLILSPHELGPQEVFCFPCPYLCPL